MPGEPGLITPIGCQRCRTISRRGESLLAELKRAARAHDRPFGAALTTAERRVLPRLLDRLAG